MNYFNTAWITDTHAKRLALKENITVQLSDLDDEIEAVVQPLIGSIDNLPIDENDYITSTALKTYAKFWLYERLFSDFWGSTQELRDIYAEKAGYNLKKANTAKNDLNKENLIGNSPITKTGQVKQNVLY